MSNENADRRRAIAFHEAGHALAGLVVGFDIIYATIHPSRAHVSIPSNSFRAVGSDDDRLNRNMLFAVAGDVAQSLGQGDREFEVPSEVALREHLQAVVLGFGTDRQKEATFLTLFRNDLGVEDQVAEWRQHFLDCFILFRMPVWRTALSRVASRLMEDDTISGKVIASLVDLDLLRAPLLEPPHV